MRMMELSEELSRYHNGRDDEEDYATFLCHKAANRIGHLEEACRGKQKTIDDCLKMMEAIPKGYCEACTQLWIDRTRKMIEEISNLFEP